MSLKILINTRKLEENAAWIVEQAKTHNISVTGIVKCTCAHPAVAKAMITGGVSALGDSRVENLMKISDLDCEKWLIRIPMLSEAEEVVKVADVSLNSELKVIRALDAAAARLGKKHKVVLMVDLGDLREGIFEPEDVYAAVDVILQLENIEFYGIGSNLSCTGTIIPTVGTYEKFGDIINGIKNRFGVDCHVTSAGASSTFYMLNEQTIPPFINHLRIGEFILFGMSTSDNNNIETLHHDVFTVEAEIIEIQNKPSRPIGKIGLDAFGNTKTFVDKGIRKRAICALGHQDVDFEDLTPYDERSEMIASSSDHLIVDITDSAVDYQVGDVMHFGCNYHAALQMFTSPYSEKVVVE